MWTDDPIADFYRHDALQNAKLKERPQCSECDNHIQDNEAYYINGEWICAECMETEYKRNIDPDL